MGDRTLFMNAPAIKMGVGKSSRRRRRQVEQSRANWFGARQLVGGWVQSASWGRSKRGGELCS